MIRTDTLIITYDYADNGDCSALTVSRLEGDKLVVINGFSNDKANKLYCDLAKIKTEPGCEARNVWGKVEFGKRLCRMCDATYESKAVCNTISKKYYPVMKGESND